jgi:hypothetical protein
MDEAQLAIISAAQGVPLVQVRTMAWDIFNSQQVAADIE